MNKFARRSGLAILLLAMPVLADEKAKSKTDDDKPVTKETRKDAPPRTQVLNKIAAKVVSVNPDEKTLTVEIAVPTASRRSYKATKEDIPYTDDLKVRTPYIPDQKDDSGKKKTLSPAEKAKAKGDPKLPGYTADLSHVVPGAIVEIELSVHKPAPGEAKKGIVEKPFASMVVILLAEEQRQPGTDKPKAEKKK